jgi:hypothetical protein
MPYGQPPPYGYAEPPPGYVGPPGYGPPQRKRRTGLVVGVVLAVVVLIGAGIGAYFVFFHQSGQNSANATPQQVVTGFAQSYTSLAHSLSTDDLAKVKSYLCATDQTAVQAIYDHEKSANGADKTFTMTASGAATSGTTGSFTLKITDHGNQPEPHKGGLVRQNSRWLVCNTLATPN